MSEQPEAGGWFCCKCGNPYKIPEPLKAKFTEIVEVGGKRFARYEFESAAPTCEQCGIIVRFAIAEIKADKESGQ